MKVKMSSLAMIASVGVVGLSAGVANSTSSAGINCVSWGTGNLPGYTPSAALNPNYDNNSILPLACPVDMDHTPSGSTVTFRLKLFDNSTTKGFSCTATVYDSNGSAIATSSAMTTPTTSTGTYTLYKTINVAPQSSFNTYAINCQVPGNQSAVLNVSAY